MMCDVKSFLKVQGSCHWEQKRDASVIWNQKSELMCYVYPVIQAKQFYENNVSYSMIIHKDV